MAAYAKPIRPSRARRQHMDAAARVAGCTCKQPDHEIVRWYSDRVQHAHTYHEDGCPALQAGRIALVVA